MLFALSSSKLVCVAPSLPPSSRLPQASFDFTTPFAGSRGATPLASASPEHAAVLEVKEEAPSRDPGGAGDRTPVAIILEPARELAEQVSDCLATFKVCVWVLPVFFVVVVLDSSLG